MRPWLALLALAAAAAPPADRPFLAPLPESAVAALADMGRAADLPLHEWGWEKKWADAQHVLPLAALALDEPLGALEEVRSLAAADPFAAALPLLGMPAQASPLADWALETAPPEWDEAGPEWMSLVAEAARQAEAVARFAEGLGERRDETAERAKAMLGGDDSAEAAFAGLGAEPGLGEYLAALLAAGPVAAPPPEALPRAGSWDTEWGRVGVGTTGRDSWEGEWLLIVDPGGDDVYRLAGGPWRASFVVDLAGDDLYEAGAWPAAGSGVLGAGGIRDLGGDDRYEGGRAAWGVGWGGVGWVVDEAGDDAYEGHEHSQGAGFVGVGVLADLAGSDTYRSGRLSQGFGYVLGVGWLADGAGDDLYYAMGTHLHQPLYQDRYQSLSQGFAIGMRYEGVAGGVGVLHDRLGNDRYLAEVYCQGSGYWYGVGVLLDEEGNDAYSCHIYGQGAGIHLAAGFLVDGAGSDTYALLDGVGQGGGHDLAVGVLHDRAGHDYYAGAGLAQGSGNANGLGLLVDEGGNDGYSGVKRGIQGWGNAARGFFSAGFLLDLGGADRYTDGLEDGAFAVRSAIGVSWDVPEQEEEE